MAKRASKYRLGERIGAGGMGEVFFGELHGTGGFVRPVAIKRLHPLADGQASALLTREARICSRLHHPNVVSVLDFERDSEGRLLLIMEWVDGVELATLSGWKRLPIELVEYIVGCMLRGLAYAHEHGVIHRDVTPRNVLLARTGEVKLTDFGLAKALEPISISTLSSTKGTPGYMSPEQFLDHPLDGRSDLFSVGIILYELLTQVRPFMQKSLPAMVAHVLKDRPPPPIELRPELPEALSDITMRLLEKDPEDRFASALEVLDALPAPKYGAEDLAGLVRECMEEGVHARQWLESGRTGRPEDNPAAMRLPEYQRSAGQKPEATPREESGEEMPETTTRPRMRAEGMTQDAPEGAEPETRPRTSRRGVFRALGLAVVAFCAGLAVALVWLRSAPDAPMSGPQNVSEDARPDAAEDARPRMAAEPVTEDAATADAAASVPATPARSTRARSRASTRPTEPSEQPESPTTWREIPIGTETPWDVPIQRGENP